MYKSFFKYLVSGIIGLVFTAGIIMLIRSSFQVAAAIIGVGLLSLVGLFAWDSLATEAEEQEKKTKEVQTQVDMERTRKEMEQEKANDSIKGELGARSSS